MTVEALLKLLSAAVIVAIWWMIMRRRRFFERYFGLGRHSHHDGQDRDLD